MSWDKYITKIEAGKGVVAGGIYSLKKGKVWATSKGFKVPSTEVLEILATMKAGTSSKKPKLCGEEYILLRIFDNKTMYAKSGKKGFCATKTGKCLIVGKYDTEKEEGAQPSHCNVAVEQLADALIEQGY